MAKQKIKLPKTVVGVPVPKALRKSRTLGKLASNPLGREILADVLVAAAGAAAAALLRKGPSGAQVARAGATVADAGGDAAVAGRDLVQTATGAVAEVVADAARQILPASLTGAEDRRKKGRKAERKAERYGHIADRETRKGKKAKQGPKVSRH